MYYDTREKSLHIETEQIPFSVPNGYFLCKAKKGWKIKEVFHMTKVEPDSLERKHFYVNLDCDGTYQDERYLIQKGESVQICELCQFKMSCMMGSSKRFETTKEIELEKEKGMAEWVQQIKKNRNH